MPTRSNIVVFAASNSTKSINRRLALHAARILRDEFMAPVEIEVLDLNDYEMPIYSPEREAQGIPQLAHDFYDKLGAADGVIISFAEYNGAYSAAFKNIFDWSSRIKMKIFQERPVMLMATSMGGRGGQNVLAAAMGGFPHFGANITSNFSFGPFNEHFDTQTDQLKTPELALELREAIAAFRDALPASA
ncbi:NAD(P)H-dependent oxidoreductase [Marivita sp.]|uniref:NADPH-dependent FMN reductase n=1 Tax=Marivita sp. TaxID=2003365 RepID=UPI0025BC06AE|nr:NAD(P)H-dependent oxidoreductase [Marivita sp.]